MYCLTLSRELKLWPARISIRWREPWLRSDRAWNDLDRRDMGGILDHVSAAMSFISFRLQAAYAIVSLVSFLDEE